MEIPSEKSQERKKIEGYFSQEFYLDREELVEFLRKLADELESGEELKITTEEWVLPFMPKPQAELEIELEDTELEIEIEFDELKEKGKELSVE